MTPKPKGVFSVTVAVDTYAHAWATVLAPRPLATWPQLTPGIVRLLRLKPGSRYRLTVTAHTRGKFVLCTPHVKDYWHRLERFVGVRREFQKVTRDAVLCQGVFEHYVGLPIKKGMRFNVRCQRLKGEPEQ